MSVPYSNRMFHDEPISDSNHSADALDDPWVEDAHEADVSDNYKSYSIASAESISVFHGNRRLKRLTIYLISVVVRLYSDAL